MSQEAERLKQLIERMAHRYRQLKVDHSAVPKHDSIIDFPGKKPRLPADRPDGLGANAQVCFGDGI